jgi:tetratricopeptide (TPR) repeat protein
MAKQARRVVRAHPQEIAVMRAIAGFFDPDWYEERHPDVVAANLDPLQHFIHHGLAERRDPNRFFDSAWYTEHNPDVRVSGTHPLLHYLQSGAAELRNPNPHFDAAWYAGQHPDSAANPLLYHITTGLALGYPTEKPSDALHEQGQRAQEDGGIAAQIQLPAVDPVTLSESARTAEQSGDWLEAEQLWNSLRSRFPAALDGYIGQAHALRKQGRQDEARAVLQQAVEQFPSETDPLHELARLAEARGDWASSERFWREYIVLDPNFWGCHTGLAEALRRQGRLDDADAALAEGEARFPDDPTIIIGRSRIVQLRGDWNAALIQWNKAFAQVPDDWESSHGRATALTRLGRATEARDTLEAAISRFPTRAELLHDYARLAEDVHDWATAEQAWRAFIAVMPGMGWAHARLGSALLKQDRAEEAEAILVAALHQFPDDTGIVAEHARVVQQRTAPTETPGANDNGLALAKPAAAAESAPSLAEAHAWNRRLATLMNNRQFDEFATTWLTLPKPLQSDQGIMSIWCTVACLTGDWAETLRRADEMAEKWPDSTEPLVFRIHAIAGLHGYEEASRTIDSFLAEHDKAPNILAAAIVVALAAKDFEQVIEYSQRIRDLSERFFGPGPRHASAIAHRALGQFEVAAAEITSGLTAHPGDWLLKAAAKEWGIPEPEPEPDYVLPELASPRSSYVVMRGDAEIEAVTGLTPRDLVGRFDTLGENCEFGFVQRAMGAEPISLMRFAGMRWEEMVFALNSSFDGIDRPGNLMPIVEAGAWDIRDLRYNIAYHTFQPVETTPKAQLMAKEARRLRWLADKLLDDLKNGDKAFVAWRVRAEDPPNIIPLLRAVRRHGNATVILVESGDGDPGVEEIAPGFLRGRVGQVQTPHGHPPDIEGWLAMLGNAWLLLRPPADGRSSGSFGGKS